ncbi:centromere protein O-like [Dendronephthya gigantea]|uniref:centromere protein O-like n=1 Tax=Dendronephthya gigantea TaxID=151771 RepID=UPI00106C251F|nr:centromere protein O-like [Dendronephthya gigantea]
MAGNERDVFLKGNTLREFERLRKKSSSVSEGRLHWTKDDELIELEQEYNELLKQKEELTKKVNEGSLLNQLHCYVQKHAEDGIASLGDLADENNLCKAIELVKKKKLMETYNIYRLTGLAFVLLDENRVRFCLDTFYKECYHEPFYIEIKIEDEKVQILKHTIPFFIPLEEIHQKYKTSACIKELLAVISGYLKAFVSRRQQCAQVKSERDDYSVKDFYATPAFDFVKFALKFSRDDSPGFEVKLKYSNLNQTLPNAVDLKCFENCEDVQDNKLKDDLRGNLLSLEIKEAILNTLWCCCS